MVGAAAGYRIQGGDVQAVLGNATRRGDRPEPVSLMATRHPAKFFAYETYVFQTSPQADSLMQQLNAQVEWTAFLRDLNVELQSSDQIAQNTRGKHLAARFNSDTHAQGKLQGWKVTFYSRFTRTEGGLQGGVHFDGNHYLVVDPESNNRFYEKHQVTDCAVLELGAQWAPAALVLVWVFGVLARIVVGPATRKELSDIMEIEASAQQESDGKIWYLLSPDLDVYPVLVDAPDLRGYELLDNDGSVLLRSGLRRGGRPVYGSEWEPTALELVDAMEAVSPQRQPERRMMKKGPLPPTETAAQTPTDLVNIVTGSDRLPDVKPLRWYVTAGPNKSEIDGLFPHTTVDEFARSDDVALAVVGTGVYTLRALDPKDGVVQVVRDDRLLALAKDSSGIRKKLFRDAVQEVTESPWPGWPLLGPRTAAWCVRFIAEQDSHPRARNTKWLHETGLTQADPGVADHEVAMRAFEFGLVYDQVNVGELVSFELLARRAQMAEWRYRDRLAPRRADETAEDEHLYMGTGETRGLIMMAPFLVEHISTELHRESQVMKEKRKLREERQLANGTGADGETKDALRKKVESQAPPGSDGRLGSCCRTARSRLLRHRHVDGWSMEVHQALNCLHGRGGPGPERPPTLGQSFGSEHVRAAVQSIGAPTTTGAAAFKELCASKPGYSSMPVKPAAFQRDLVAPPSPGAKCDGASILQGEALNLWEDWQQRLLRKNPEVSAVKPHCDAKLMQSKSSYASFVADLYDAVLVKFGSLRESTLGIFFAPKSDGKLRLIFDTRCVNQLFEPPAHTALPTAGCWKGLLSEPNDELCLSQVDVEACFYRMRAPPGMEEVFVLPPLDCGALRRLRPDIAISGDLTCSPLLIVLPMGWNWSLFLYQEMVTQCVQRAGYPPSRIIADKRATPSLVGQTAAAVYVDGVAVIGTQSAQTVQDCRAIAEALLAAGLVTKDMELPQDEQPFTRLIFEKGSGRISLSRSRIWRIRRAFQYAAEADKLTGVQMRMLLGHYTWAAMLRRPLLSVFAACYSFAEKAGDMAWRPWATVRRELRLGAALAAMAFVDLRRPVAATVLATDASGGARQVCSIDPDLAPPGLEPAAARDCGGFGVVSREVSRCAVAAALQLSEKWRLKTLDFLGARASALGLRDDPRGAAAQNHPPPSKYHHVPPSGMGESANEPSSSTSPPHRYVITWKEEQKFFEIGKSILGSQEDWKVCFYGRFNRAADIVILEGEALVMGVRHFVRNTANHGRRLLLLCDNMGLVLASGKGRSSVSSLNLVLRRLAAISIFANIDITVRWIPSELNPADAPSRPPAARAQNARLDLRSFGGRSAPEPEDDSLWRAAAEELAAEGRPRRRDPGLAGLGDAAAPAALAGGFGLHRGGVGVQPNDSSDSDSESEPAAGSTARATTLAQPTGTALTYLQERKIRASSNVHFATSYRTFDIWCQAHAVPVQNASEIDMAISEYMDVLYFDGMPSDVASKTIAAVRHFRPAAVGEAELAAVFCLIGLAMLDGGSEFAEALSLAWDTALRLPSDLMQLRSPSLVPPQPRMHIGEWSLLLYPEETGLRSKGKQFDEGVQLTPAGSKALGPVLARLRERPAQAPLRALDARRFGQLFRKYAEMINLKDPHPYRVRHGSASWDIASGTRSLEAVQARLRHASATSTQRYSRAARCTAELALAPESVKTFGAAVADQWALTLRGRSRLPPRPRRPDKPCRTSPGLKTVAAVALLGEAMSSKEPTRTRQGDELSYRPKGARVRRAASGPLVEDAAVQHGRPALMRRAAAGPLVEGSSSGAAAAYEDPEAHYGGGGARGGGAAREAWPSFVGGGAPAGSTRPPPQAQAPVPRDAHGRPDFSRHAAAGAHQAPGSPMEPPQPRYVEFGRALNAGFREGFREPPARPLGAGFQDAQAVSGYAMWLAWEGSNLAQHAQTTKEDCMGVENVS
ncbi:unnamed protein product [Prorocentrum cordatum]|uniref:Uncharacterized protein n=1 Tax=Prorocentrum cordatum TaxID=2364126 RepID=A0ABN9T0B8_9DINO|nr:unnamed protein product [Polarella glacialis]